MKVSATLEVYFHDLKQESILIKWGSTKRRRRMRPDTLTVVWDQKMSTKHWSLWHVWCMGEYAHAASSHSFISTTFYEKDQWAPDTPDWVKELVDRSMPVHRAAA